MALIVYVVPTMLTGIIALLFCTRTLRVAASSITANLALRRSLQYGSLRTRVGMADLPLELVSGVADWLERRDLASFVRTCRCIRDT